jgi:hypothetical protein
MLNSSTDYQANIYASIRQISARITFTINGTSTVYDNTYITQLTLSEEMSTLSDSIPSDELQVTLDNTTGTFDFLNMSNMYQIIASHPSIFVELGLVLSDGVTIEWQPMGLYFLDAWKNNFGALTVTLIAHDNFTMLENISYGAQGVGVNKSLYDIAVDVFKTAGITNYNIDASLKKYTTTTGFSDSVSCRVALQHIGIAAMCAVFQDRQGTMQIKPFSSIDAAQSYSNYVGGYGLYAGFDQFNSGLYAEINDGNGMLRLDMNNMWAVPEITLDRSIYQLTVKVYSSTSNATDYTVTNTGIAGQNGQSFTIDNPLINTTVLAQSVANWFIKESNYNVVYKANWRGNPILEGADIVTISNGLDTAFAKQARIYKQDWQYEGYLSCQTQVRGGV